MHLRFLPGVATAANPRGELLRPLLTSGLGGFEDGQWGKKREAATWDGLSLGRNSQKPEEATAQVTCARCRRHARMRDFPLRLLERIRHRV